MLAVLLPALVLLAMTHAEPSVAQDRQAAHRARMVEEIAAMARETGAETGRPKSGDTVLEVGTGSGYQAAVLAELAAKVYTIEIVEPLGKRAMRLLRELGYRNVEVRIGDGYNGWPEAAPFDSIVVTAAPKEVPKPLIDQLKLGGRMV